MSLMSRVIPATPKDMGPPKMVSGTHSIPIFLGIFMGVVWEAYHKGVPLLGVPENPIDSCLKMARDSELIKYQPRNGWCGVPKPSSQNTHELCLLDITALIYVIALAAIISELFPLM